MKKLKLYLGLGGFLLVALLLLFFYYSSGLLHSTGRLQAPPTRARVSGLTGTLTAEVQECEMSGYEFCYQNQYGDAIAILGASFYDPNDIKWTDYHERTYAYITEPYKFRWKCNGEVYYGATECDEHGCNGEQLSSQGAKTLDGGYTDRVYVKNLRCWVSRNNYWSWVQFDAFYPHWEDSDGYRKNLLYVECGQDEDCPSGYCDRVPEDPVTDWECQACQHECSGGLHCEGHQARFCLEDTNGCRYLAEPQLLLGECGVECLDDSHCQVKTGQEDYLCESYQCVAPPEPEPEPELKLLPVVAGAVALLSLLGLFVWMVKK